MVYMGPGGASASQIIQIAEKGNVIIIKTKTTFDLYLECSTFDEIPPLA